MSARGGLILDANILLRAIFGRRVQQLLQTYEDEARFYTPDVCFEDAQRYIPIVSKDRGFDSDLGFSVLRELSRVVKRVDRSLYEEYERSARERIASRDPDDWPVVAAALLLDLPIWTEDQDFLAAASLPGQLIESNSTSNNADLLPLPLIADHSLCAPTPTAHSLGFCSFGATVEERRFGAALTARRGLGA